MFKKLIQKVRKLHIPTGTFAIFGSGPMAIRGLKEPNDIDIIVTKETYQLFKNNSGWVENTFHDGKKHYLEKGGIELWDDWGPGDWDILQLIKTAEMINGLPYVTMDNVLKWKEKNNRPKDVADIVIIKKYLAQIRPK